MVSPIALGGLLVAPISAGVNSFFGFQRAKQKHLLAMIHRLYYLTLANNASVLTRLIDSAEDEEYKEAMLAYFFLWRRPRQRRAVDRPALDEHIETLPARRRPAIAINFEVSDALAKLFRLGLAHARCPGRLSRHPHRPGPRGPRPPMGRHVPLPICTVLARPWNRGPGTLLNKNRRNRRIPGCEIDDQVIRMT